MSKSLLIDTTRCTGCRGCQVACKQWNGLPAEKTSFSADWTNPPALSAYTYSLVEFHTAERPGGGLEWTSVSKRCFHCLEPACVSSCPVGALQKTADGPVVYDEDKCMGCRYCMVACPFNIPKFTWDKAVPVISKCTFCFDRIDAGLEPSCAKTCPTDAITFGERDHLLGVARSRLAANPNKYVDYIYGEREAGGTSLLYLSAVPFDTLGFKMNVEKSPYPALTWEALSKIPWEVAGVVAIAVGVLYWRNRKMNAEAEKMAGKAGR